MNAIGVYVHAEPDRLLATLAALREHTAAGFELLLLPDGPDPATREALAALPNVAQSATDVPAGAAACFNRLARATTADTLVLLESGTIVGPGWLETLNAALTADPQHGLASPSTNRAWNQLAAFPAGTSDAADIARSAAEAARRFGVSSRSLAPLWDVGDFCLVVRRSVVEAVGAANEAYGLGPCWEMDYAVRAVRAGFLAVWAPGAYVFRHPFTERRQREEARLMEASRRRYQDTFCGLRRSGARRDYAAHCRGEECPDFAPVALFPVAATPAVAIRNPLVSCIMPTKGRREWIVQAIHYFERQDYEQRELVIVDASSESSAALIPSDERIHYWHIPTAQTIGAMRNIACDRASGDIVLHWDDDDWYAANRVSAQVRPILDGTADITALNDTCFFDLHAWAFWRCTPQLHKRLFVGDVHGGTLAFRRSLFGGDCRYPEISLAEDAAFLQRAISRGARLAALSGEGLFVYVRHDQNAWAFPCGRYLDPAGWRQAPQPDGLSADHAFYLKHSRASGALTPPLGEASLPQARQRVAIGVYVHAEPNRLFATLAAVQAHTAPGFALILLADGPDPAIRSALAALPYITQSVTDVASGAAACFNRLARASSGETLVLLESGTIVGPGWLETLTAALATDPQHGLVSPSTNRAWNQLAAFPNGRADPGDIAETARTAARQFGTSWRSLAPLWDVGDFCLVVRRSVVDAVGEADEAYGLGPCWEMDYAVRAVRAGFLAIWAPGAYVFRHPFTPRRQRDEARLMEASRRRYQDRFCGMRLSGARRDYAAHCRGDACEDFAKSPPTIRSTPVTMPVVIHREPLVSCIMPTKGRRRFVPSAIKCFLDQDYAHKELIVVDDGDDAVADLIQRDSRIRYFHETSHRSIGSKRNSACAEAGGDIIVHWDDDDWHAPWQLAYQVAELQTSGAELCGLDRILFIDESAGRAWEYVYPLGGAPWVHGATLCYRRDLWEQNRFADMNVGEDTHFVFAAGGRHIRALPRSDFFVGRIHALNVSPKQTRDGRWQPAQFAIVRALIS